MMAFDTAQIFFDDVRVPQRFRIGEEGMGFTYQMQQFQEERLWAAANAVEALLRNLNDTVDYIRERKIFGQTVLDFQVVHFRLAELKTEVEALRALTYRAVDLYVSGHDVTELASMTKLKAGRLLREVPDACLQYWGGMGPGTTRSCARIAMAGSRPSAAGRMRSCSASFVNTWGSCRRNRAGLCANKGAASGSAVAKRQAGIACQACS